MPELAEVETFRRLAHHTLFAQELVYVSAAEDSLVFDDVNRDDVEQRLRGRMVVGTGRHGKHAWLHLDNDRFLLLQFGMSGELVCAEPSEEVRHAKLELVTEGGLRLVYRCPRRIGRIRFRDTLFEEAPLKGLGADPYLSLPEVHAFVDLLSAKKKTIKGVLLDQNVLAGVGNWLADEVLFQSRIAPQRRACELSFDEVVLLRTCLTDVLALAVEVNADETRFPKTWLFHVRWGKKTGSRTQEGDLLVFDKVAGRTTAWVPKVQK
ncbi:MAG: hypothetical protein GY822_02950 [Deltaproteobacteria bacterium]|nr:hypothetical protein [Deltaproteobacteria bacterium]